ncbi:Rne/Rng family ribonuclease [Brachybacterium huguangmaarense]|uniref:Rne/Rng family ribonuclease n=1 Tax=Brachybacterium huguangmaarense TaxID=1652028 RepID=A0ABY6G0A4_9MICO|nr:Rne/Rng family ribonuclease [Brachybacterium huguangmaarense]UYG16108.1 Rne/Rng family ribonuclease [Brachybacterium huguangmaarense]
MADDSRTPTDETTTASETPTAEEARPRRRRRAGAPVGAPAPAAAETEAEPHAPLTSVPEQETAPVEVVEQAPARSRRRAGAPAGPPSAPVFSAAQAPAVPEAAADEDEEDEGDQDAVEAETSATSDTDREEGSSGVAEALASLADRRPARERSDDEAAARRERAQLDFSSLLFQAPAPRTADEAPEEAPEDSTESDEGSETDASDDEGGAGTARRRRRRGGRGRRGRGRGDNVGGDEGSESDAEETAGSSEAGAEETASSSDTSTEESASSDDESGEGASRRSRSRGSRSRKRSNAGSTETAEEPEGSESADGADTSDAADTDESDDADKNGGSSSRRRRRRRRSGSSGGDESPSPDDPPNTVVKVRERRDEVKSVKGSTRLEAKKQRRREGRDAGRRRNVITEAEFLARRESVKRSMIVRERPGRTQIAVLEDDVLVEHYVAQKTQSSMVGNVYLGKVQNVLPSMEAAFVDIGKGRNAVLYAGEVNWDAAGLEGQPRRIELALKSGDPVLVQVTKDPIGHKGARLTSQVSLPGRYVVFVPGGSMTGISRKLPDNERARLKKIMKQVIPEGAGVIVRTAAEGASEEELTRDVERLRAQWEKIEKAQKSKSAPVSLSQEPDLAIKVVRDVFNEDFTSLIVEGERAYSEVHRYVSDVAPDLLERVTKHVGEKDSFAKHRVDEQLLKAMDRKVYLPSGGSLVIDRTEAMTVIDVNTGKFTGSGGSLEETVTRNNLEAAEEIVRQLRLRDIGGIIVIDFIDMVLEDNRDLVLRRLVECLGRDRTKHQVAEVTSLGLVQMTRKRVGQGLVETFSTTCEHCNGRGVMIDIDGKHHHEAPEKDESSRSSRRRGGNGKKGAAAKDAPDSTPEGGDAENVHRLEEDSSSRELARATIASIAAATTAHTHPEVMVDGQVISVDQPEPPEDAEPAADDASTGPAEPAEQAEPVAEQPADPAAEASEPIVEPAAEEQPAESDPAASPVEPSDQPVPAEADAAEQARSIEPDADEAAPSADSPVEDVPEPAVAPLDEDATVEPATAEVADGADRAEDSPA